MFPPLLYLVLLFGLLLCFPLGIFPLPVLALGPVKIYAQNYLQARLSEVNRQ